MTHGGCRNGLTVIDLEECHIAGVAERDQDLAPAGIFLAMQI